jgi:hypothetical protein
LGKGKSGSQAKKRRFPLVHWVLPNKLAIGRLPRRSDEAILTEAKIQVILTLCAPSEGQLPPKFAETFHCIRYILPDSKFLIPLRVEQLAHAVDLLHRQIQMGQTVYLHCLAGVQRSPTVCVAYLCRYEHLKLWEAMSYVKQIRSQVSLTDAHVQVIQAFLEGKS